MQQLLFATDNSWTGMILRITLALIMFPHGAQKLLGLFGGVGFQITMKYFTETMKLPWLLSFLVIVIEFVGPVGLIIGIASRLWAMLFMIVMIAAIITTNFQHGFFMNWFGNQKGEGYEYHLLMIGICIALMFTGGGRWSLDQVFQMQTSSL